MKRGDKIYAFVGSAGMARPDKIMSGGYNGGGPGLQCIWSLPGEAHSGTGGGATHISEVYNPIINDYFQMNGGNIYISEANYIGNVYLVRSGSWSQLDKVIAVAGGSGGQASKSNGYAGGNKAGGVYSMYYEPHVSNYKPADNNTSVGYARGFGMWCCGSSAGGGGWYSGYSRSDLQRSNNCTGAGGGGTSYIRSGIDGFMIAGNDPLNNPGQPYEKPATEGVNGYIKVIKE